MKEINNLLESRTFITDRSPLFAQKKVDFYVSRIDSLITKKKN